MKQIKWRRRILTQKIKDNLVLSKYSVKSKRIELINENKYLETQLKELSKVKPTF